MPPISKQAGLLTTEDGNHPPRYVFLAIVPALAMAPLTAKWVLDLGLPFPVCMFRKLTGIPCATCGCTRSLAAWADLDPGRAFLLNPLFFCVCLVLMFWLGTSGLERLSGRTLLPNLRNGIRRVFKWRLGLALLAVNWLYLCLKLPR